MYVVTKNILAPVLPATTVTTYIFVATKEDVKLTTFRITNMETVDVTGDGTLNIRIDGGKYTVNTNAKTMTLKAGSCAEEDGKYGLAKGMGLFLVTTKLTDVYMFAEPVATTQTIIVNPTIVLPATEEVA